jgi:GDP-L-fucose synthase
MVGSALVRQLEKVDGVQLILRSRAELDLCDQAAVKAFFAEHQIDQVYLAAAKVGGIQANNNFPAEFIYQNLMIEANIIDAAYRSGVKKLLFLGSSCIYPKLATQPMAEDALLTGVLEPTNEPYAIAKIAGIKLCESYNRQYGTDYRSVMPTNLYGSNDNFHPENSHVIPALMRRFHEAKIHMERCEELSVKGDAENASPLTPDTSHDTVTVWGSGTPLREFLHVDDMAAASIHVQNLPPEVYSAHTEPMLSHINVGTGIDCSIREMAETMADVVGFKGAVVFDADKPDGTPRKLMSVERLAELGWRAQISLRDGLTQTYAWFVANQDKFRS